MKRIKTIFIYLCVFSCTINIYAQPPKAPTVALSPNAANLGLYGEIPVSLFTGTPDISIPLYDVLVGDFKLPISLSYHPSGIRPEQRPGEVGLGWSLNAGGLITRVIKDAIDEYHNPNYYQHSGDYLGYYYNHNVLNTTTWNQLSYLRSVAQSGSSLKDTEPDEFSFSFSGYSGKFYLTHTGTWVVQCNKPVKVVFDGTFLDIPFSAEDTEIKEFGYPKSFSGFTIITEDGTQYIFGGTTDAIEYSIGFFSQSVENWKATAWYLVKIKLPNKRELNFEYHRSGFTNQMYISVTSIREAASSYGFLSSSCSFTYDPSISECYQGQLIAPVSLYAIYSDNNTVRFFRSVSNSIQTYSQGLYDSHYPMSGIYLPFLNCKTNVPASHPNSYPKCLEQLARTTKLTEISIHPMNSLDIKHINFSYSDSLTQRLILTSVTKYGEAPYKFDYYNASLLPSYLSNKTDHWGFYNNTYASINNYNSYYSYREPKSPYMKYGVISKITYPTGGYTEFEFEPHYYRKQVKLNRWEELDLLSENKMAGGVRIKRISNYTSTNSKSSEKKYYYVSDYLQNNTNANISSGILGGQAKYYFPNYTIYSFNNNNASLTMSVFSSNSVLPSCHNANGSHIGYSEVVERREDNSFIRYLFTNFDNGYMDEQAEAIIQASHTPYEPYSSKERYRGLLRLQEEYNTAGKKIKSKSIVYEPDDNSTTNYVRSMNARGWAMCNSQNMGFDEGASYKIYTYLLRPQIETETYYNPESESTWQTVNRNYTYTNKKLIRSVSITNSDGIVHKTEYKYPFDVTGNFNLTYMVNINALSPVIEADYYTNSSIIKKEFTDYSFTNGVYHPISFSVQNGNNTKETRMNYSNQDNYGNPTFVNKDDADKTIYLWGYKGQYVIAEIKNMDYASILSNINFNTISSKENPSNSDWENINNLRNSFPNAHITTYKYKPTVGLIESMDSRGITTYYNYDSDNRLSEIYIMEDGVKKIIQSYNYHYQNQ